MKPKTVSMFCFASDILSIPFIIMILIFTYVAMSGNGWVVVDFNRFNEG